MLVNVLLDDAVGVMVDVDVAVVVTVAVEVDETDAVEVAEALNVPEAVSDPEIDCVLVLVLLAVEVDVGVAVDVEVDVAVGVAVIDDDADAVAVDVAVAVAELDDSSANSCVPISVSNQTTYWLFMTLRTASTIAVLRIVHLIGRSSSTVALYCFHSFSIIAKTILRMSPVAASASAAVISGKVAIGTVMSVPFSDQPASHVVGVLSKDI